jgi:hypothetical protein
MTNLEQRRAAFEMWWETREEAGTAAKYRAFDAWNAALDGVVIALPRDVSLRSPSEVRDMIKHHIEAAGLKVTP